MVVETHLISRLKDQEETAVHELLDCYYEPINRYLYGLVRDPEIAAELTQETFLQAYKALPRLADDSNLSAWLYRIATNLARNHHRRRQLIRWLPLTHLQGQQDHLEHRIVEHSLVERVLDQLPGDYKVCLLLQVWEGFTCAEIGQIVGKTEDAVKMTLVRARRRFREVYASLANEE